MTSKDYGIQAIKDEAQALLALADEIDDEFEQAVNMMYDCKGKVIVTGVGKSGHIGEKIAATLSSTGTPSFFVNPLDAYHGDIGVMTPGDVVLAISNSGQTEELLRFLPMVQHMGLPIIGMSGNRHSQLARYATCHIYVGVEREACPLNLAPTSSTTAQLAMGDALAIALIEKRHFQPQDFACFHPGGELGRRLLTTAQDVMRTNDLPIMSPNIHLGEAIILASKGKMGMGVAMTDDHIDGIFTDGDIRRAMEHWQAAFFDHTVSDIMTRQPKTVSPDTKVTEIQRIMQRHNIHSMLVVDAEGHLLGIIDSNSCMI